MSQSDDFQVKTNHQIKKKKKNLVANNYEGVRIMQEELYGSTYCQVMSCQWKAQYVLYKQWLEAYITH